MASLVWAALSLFLCAFFLLPFLLPFVLLFLFSLSVVDNRVGVVDRGIFIVVENCFTGGVVENGTVGGVENGIGCVVENGIGCVTENSPCVAKNGIDSVVENGICCVVADSPCCVAGNGVLSILSVIDNIGRGRVVVVDANLFSGISFGLIIVFVGFCIAFKTKLK